MMAKKASAENQVGFGEGIAYLKSLDDMENIHMTMILNYEDKNMRKSFTTDSHTALFQNKYNLAIELEKKYEMPSEAEGKKASFDRNVEGLLEKLRGEVK